MNKIIRAQGKTVFLLKRQKTQNTKKGWRPTAPKNTCSLFLFLSLWSPHGHLSSSYTLFIAKVSLILFFYFRCFVYFSSWWLCFVCLFPSLSLLCSSFLILLFFFPFPALSLVWPKKPDRITEYLKCSCWCSALVPASSHFDLAQLRTPTRPNEPPRKIVLNNVLKYLFLRVSWTSTKISPKMDPKENDNLSQSAKPKLVF